MGYVVFYIIEISCVALFCKFIWFTNSFTLLLGNALLYFLVKEEALLETYAHT